MSSALLDFRYFSSLSCQTFSPRTTPSGSICLKVSYFLLFSSLRTRALLSLGMSRISTYAASSLLFWPSWVHRPGYVVICVVISLCYERYGAAVRVRGGRTCHAVSQRLAFTFLRDWKHLLCALFSHDSPRTRPQRLVKPLTHLVHLPTSCCRAKHLPFPSSSPPQVH